MPRPYHRELPLPINTRIEIVEQQTLADDWFVLKKTVFKYLRNDGCWQLLQRETYDRGNGAVLLLFNSACSTVVLTRQFRFPVFSNGSADGMLVEACAGLLDDEDPVSAIRREVAEETGFVIKTPHKIFEAYLSPGSVTEKLHFFIAEYEISDRFGKGGGNAQEGEDIEVIELTLEQSLEMIDNGKIQDGKTIMLLQYIALNELIR